MNAQPRLAALLLAGSLVALVSCGDDTQDAAGASVPAAATTSPDPIITDTAAETSDGAVLPGPGTTEPLGVDQILEEIGPDGIELFGGDACAREFAEIAVAAELFIAREGREPERLADLTDDLAVDIVLWDFDEELQELVPAPGSPCVDFAEQEATQICEAERQTLEIATEAYTAQYGAPPASEDELVPEFLREPVERFELDADASVVPAVDGPCDTVP